MVIAKTNRLARASILFSRHQINGFVPVFVMSKAMHSQVFNESPPHDRSAAKNKFQIIKFLGHLKSNMVGRCVIDISNTQPRWGLFLRVFEAGSHRPFASFLSPDLCSVVGSLNGDGIESCEDLFARHLLLLWIPYEPFFARQV